MNKLGFLFFFLLAIGFSKSVVIDGVDISDIYDKVAIASQGMTNNNEFKCYKDLVKYRSQIINEIVQMINDVKKGYDLALVGAIHSFTLSFYGGFMTNCRIGDIIAQAMGFIKPEGIFYLGNNMVQNSQTLQVIADEFVRASNLNGKLIAVGKMVKLITGFYVD